MKRRNSEDYELKLREPWASCERQLCSCSKPDAPRFRHQCEAGRGCDGNFDRMDYGCYRLYVGRTPEKVGEEDVCECYSQESKQSLPWNHEWIKNVENLKKKWRNN